MELAREITASAPGRCGIVGNPSDIYGGCVVSCSIPVRATCRLVIGRDRRPPEDPLLWEAALRRIPLDRPAEVHWRTDIPRSSGLSGSTALLAATLACLAEAAGRPPDLASDAGRIAFAELVRDVELKDAGIKCGYQDAYMIVLGGLRRMRFAGKHPVSAGPDGAVDALATDVPFLLITTGVERLSGSVHGPMIDRWLAGDPAVVETMVRLAELAEEGATALLERDLPRLGSLMNENHRRVAALGGSGDAIDRLIERCLHYGAYGAKLAGAGMGGTVIALTETPEILEESLRGDDYARFLRPSPGPGLRFE